MASFILFKKVKIFKTSTPNKGVDLITDLKNLKHKITSSRITVLRGYSFGKDITFLYASNQLEIFYENNNPV